MNIQTIDNNIYNIGLQFAIKFKYLDIIDYLIHQPQFEFSEIKFNLIKHPDPEILQLLVNQIQIDLSFDNNLLLTNTINSLLDFNLNYIDITILKILLTDLRIFKLALTNPTLDFITNTIIKHMDLNITPYLFLDRWEEYLNPSNISLQTETLKRVLQNGVKYITYQKIQEFKRYQDMD